MDYKLILENCKQTIINDIRGDIYELFKSKQLITENEFDEINDVKMSNTEKNEKFYRILHRVVDQQIFKDFLLMLDDHYWWVALELRQAANTIEDNRTNSEDHHLGVDYDTSIESEKLCKEVLRKGNVPLYQFSRLYVSRADMNKELSDGIKSLKPGMFLVLHGMSGSGKSSLAMNVLIDHDLVFNHLKGKVFWVYGLKTIQEIHFRLLSLISDDFEFYEESDPLRSQAQIESLLKKNGLEDALIVFDEGVKSSFIQYLNFNCKKLIITHDENIVFSDPSNEVKRIKIHYSLTEKEALILFSNASGIRMASLPEEAKTIVHLTKGFPFLLHMFAKQLEQNKGAANNGLWGSMTQILTCERKGKEVGPMDSSLQMLYIIFDRYLEQLQSEKRQCYEILAVFTRDVNLQIEVFMTVWSMKEFAVTQLLDEFQNKSLIEKKTNPHSKKKIYGIHDVLSSYLRNRKKYSLKELHNKLIDKYYAKCNGEFWNLEHDNYIHTYLGYHLEKAERFDLFDIFVNLLFVSAKIKCAGSTDLLNDYRKYKTHIVKEDNNQIFEELKDFVKHYGHSLNQSDDIDIIQLGLQQEESSAIYKSAKAFAQKRPDRIFLNFEPKHKLVDSKSDCLSFKISKDVNAACFSDQCSHAFLANNDASINEKILDKTSFFRNSPIQGHKESVLLLTLNPDKNYLLSVSKDLEFRLWNLRTLHNDQKFNGTVRGDESPSPPMRQQSYSPIFEHGSTNKQCDYIIHAAEYHKSSITCLQFSPDSKSILSCSNDKRLCIWRLEQNILSKECRYVHKLSISVPSIPRCCGFTPDGKSILVGCDNKTLIRCSVESGLNKKLFHFDSAVKCLHSVIGVNGTHSQIENSLLFVVVLNKQVKVIRIHKSYLDSRGPQQENVQNYDVLCSWSFETSSENFITRSWVPADGSFIVLTTSSNCISLFNLANGHLQRKYQYESSEEVMGIDLCMNGKNSQMLVLCRNQMLHVEKLELSPKEQALKFCVGPNWEYGDPTIVVPGINGFKVLRGDYNRQFDVKANVTSCHINREETHVVIGTDSGTVLLYVLDSNQTESRLEFRDVNRNPSLVILVRVFLIENEPLIVGVDSKHLLKISYKDKVIEHQSTHKIKGVWYCPDLKKLLLLELRQYIKVWSISNNAEIVETWYNDLKDDKPAAVKCSDMSSTNVLAIVTTNIDATNNTVRLLNVDTMEETNILLDRPVTCCGFSPDGLCLALGFEDGTIQVYVNNNSKLELRHETNLNSNLVKSVCIGNEAQVFGALSKKRIYLGRLSDTGYNFGCTELYAEHLIKAANHNSFLTIDNRSHIYKVTFFNSSDFSEPLSTLNLNHITSLPRLIIKK